MLASQRCVGLALVVALVGCGGGGNPAGPGPVASAVVLTGTVSAPSAPAGKVEGATISILDGPNAGRSATTNSAGDYRLDGLTAGNANLSCTASGYEERRAGVGLSGGANVVNFTTRTILPWSASGSGNTVFDMPRFFERVRIFGRWNGSGTSNFIVYIGGRLVVNEILRQTTTYEGVHLTNGGGVVEITNSSAITWTFTEER